MATKKKSAKKGKKLTVALSVRDFDKLTAFAKTQGKSRPVVAKRLLHAQLTALAVEKQKCNPKNQLGLFDSMQIDIFNGVSKTEE